MRSYLKSILVAAILMQISVQVPRYEARGEGSPAPSWESISNRWGSVLLTETEQQAAKGDATAQYYLGRHYFDGSGGGTNQALGLKWISSAAEKGLAEAQNRLANFYSSGTAVPRDCKTAMAWYLKAAQQDLAKAQYNLGWEYESGTCTPKNYAEAARYYQLAAAQGVDLAQSRLGYLFSNGLGVRQNATEAAKWFQKAADQGDVMAQANLGWAYLWGKGVPRNRQQAQFWVDKAADRNFAFAQYLKGQMEESQQGTIGNTILGNYQVAAEWYQKAAEQGHIPAMLALGNLYYFGKVKRDNREAYKWFRRAADAGDSEGAFLLGRLRRYNVGDLPENRPESLQWYRVAAEKGNVKAQFELACVLLEKPENGSDKQEAERWLNTAASKGSEEAKTKLANLRDHPDSKEQNVGSGQSRNFDHLQEGIDMQEGGIGDVDLTQAAANYANVLFTGSTASRETAYGKLIDLYIEKGLRVKPNSKTRPKSPAELAQILQAGSRIVESGSRIFQAGEILYAGEIVPADRQGAIEMYKRAAQKNSAEAMNRVGELWLDGAGGAPDAKEAILWFRRAAKRGNAKAEINLAHALSNSDETRIEAWAWMSLAANRGDEQAHRELASLAARLTPAQLETAKNLAKELPRGFVKLPADPR